MDISKCFSTFTNAFDIHLFTYNQFYSEINQWKAIKNAKLSFGKSVGVMFYRFLIIFFKKEIVKNVAHITLYKILYKYNKIFCLGINP